MMMINVLAILCCLILAACQGMGGNDQLRPLNCPSNVFAQRGDQNVEITCQIYMEDGYYSKIKQLSWSTPEFVLEPGGMTDNRIEFIPLRVKNGSLEATLLIRSIQAPSDYGREYKFIMFSNNYERQEATVHIIERGQGKVAFKWWDYLIFSIIMLITLGIGIYHAFIGHKVDNQKEYMLAGRGMSWLPVSMSLLASFMSAITLLGTPSEIVTFGTQYVMIAFSYPFIALISAYVLIPVYYELKITSTYEYLEMRFSKPVRIVGAGIFVLQMVLYMAMVVFAPSIALQAVMGVNFWFSSLTTVTICVFYTSMGGMRATMWTDTFQVCIMYIGLIAILIVGMIREGGLPSAWEKLASRDRFQLFEMNPDPRIRHSFWSVIIGSIFPWLYVYGANQSQVQRCLSCRSLKDVRIAYLLNVPGLISMMLIPALCGILIFSRYADCDPVSAGLVSKRDQLLIFYVVDIVAEDLPGIPGLFIASLFAGALSTISSGINGLAAVTFRDFGIEKLIRRKGWSENKITWLAKLVSVLYGGLCILTILPIQGLPGLLDSALAMFGALGGPLLGTFICGILIPWINGIGALFGLVTSVGVAVWMTMGSRTSEAVQKAQSIPSISTMSCDSERVNEGSVAATFIPSKPFTPEILSGIDNFYSISYLYVPIIAITLSILIGMMVSAVTGFKRLGFYKGDQAGLLHPSIHWLSRKLSGKKKVDFVLNDEQSSGEIERDSNDSKI